MSPWFILAMLPVGALYAYAAGRLIAGVMTIRTVEALAPIMALSALIHLVVCSLFALAPTMALFTFWSASHLIALPFVARRLRTGV